MTCAAHAATRTSTRRELTASKGRHRRLRRRGRRRPPHPTRTTLHRPGPPPHLTRTTLHRPGPPPRRTRLGRALRLDTAAVRRLAAAARARGEQASKCAQREII